MQSMINSVNILSEAEKHESGTKLLCHKSLHVVLLEIWRGDHEEKYKIEQPPEKLNYIPNPSL